MRPHFATLKQDKAALGGFVPAGYIPDAALYGVVHASHVLRSDTPLGRAVSEAQRAGLRFEKKVHEKLREAAAQHHGSYLPGPWFSYQLGNSTGGICQPDGILEIDGHSTIVEVKLTHVDRAWLQLRRLYQPVVQSAMRRSCSILEIAKQGDPHLAFPEKVNLIRKLSDVDPSAYNLIFASDL